MCIMIQYNDRRGRSQSAVVIERPLTDKYVKLSDTTEA